MDTINVKATSLKVMNYAQKDEKILKHNSISTATEQDNMTKLPSHLITINAEHQQKPNTRTAFISHEHEGIGKLNDPTQNPNSLKIYHITNALP
uniref:Uncharacterized protein n=1 Tax=Solanum tuberosum TaxID=4113 RepID=M1BCJ7_SOLTU